MNIDDEKTSPHDVITSDVPVIASSSDDSASYDHVLSESGAKSIVVTLNDDKNDDTNFVRNRTMPVDTIAEIPEPIEGDRTNDDDNSPGSNADGNTVTVSAESNAMVSPNMFIGKMPHTKTKKYRKSYERSNSANLKFYQRSTGRRVSFPENDSELVTGYLEPADPWATVKPISCISELSELYRESCVKHNSTPIDSIIKHLDTLDLNISTRRPVLNLRDQELTAESCEALEEVFKRVQYKLIDLTACGLDDVSATALFDMIEYYEAANEIDISENQKITARGWQACINMIKRSHALQILATRCTPLSDTNANNMGKALLVSSLHTLKLEHCGLSGRPMASLCNYLRGNTVLKELWLAHNDLNSNDAFTLAVMLKTNLNLQFLDVSNNKIEDVGVLHFSEALLEQARFFRNIQEELLKSTAAAAAATSAALAATLTPPQSSTDDEDLLISPSPTGVGANTVPVTTATVPAGAVNAKRSMLETLLQTQKQQEGECRLEEDKIIDNNFNNNNNDSTLNATDEVNLITAPSIIRPELETTSTQTINSTAKNVENTSGDQDVIITEFDLNENNSMGQLCSSGDDDTVVVSNDGTDGVSENDDNNSDMIKSSKRHLDNLNQSDLIVFSPDVKETLRSAGDTNVRNCSDGDHCDDVNGSDCDVNKQKIDLVKQVQIECSNNLINNQSDFFNENENVMVSGNEVATETLLDAGNSEMIENAVEAIDNNVIDNSNVVAIGIDLPSVLMENPASIIEIAPSLKSASETATTLADAFVTTTVTAATSMPIYAASPQLPLRAEIPPLTTENLKSLENRTAGQLLKSLDASDAEDNSLQHHQYNQSMLSSTPERSFSLESLNSETSVDSNDSKSSLKLAEVKFSRNGTLERQQQQQQQNIAVTPQTQPTGLQVLVLWNNRITREAATALSDLLAATTTLEILNIGRNVLSNDFLANIKSSLKTNSSLTSLGLQSAHLTCDGIRTLAEVLEFGGNSTLQRIDVRDNHLQVGGLTALNDVLKSNKSVIQIDLDDVPRRIYDQGTDSTIDYSRMVNNIRAQCTRNENPPKPEPVRTTSSAVKRCRANYLNSRKISLTCHTNFRTEVIPPSTAGSNQTKAERNLLDPGRKSGGRLRSPLPSPIPSPSQSPIPSPSRNRFQVSRVPENVATSTPLIGGIGGSSVTTSSATTSPMTPPSSNSCSPTSFYPTPKSRFRVYSVVEPLPPPPTTQPPVTIPSTLTKHKSVPDNLINNSTTPSINENITKNSTNSTKEPLTGLSITQQPTDSTQPSNLNLPYSKSQPELTAIDGGSTMPIFAQHPTVPPAPITAATALPPIPPIMSSSFDSPDLEVKRYMDDSSSSISSMDSIDHHHDFVNTSMSSMESFDLVGEPTVTPTSKVVPVKIKSEQPNPIPYIDESSCSFLDRKMVKSMPKQKLHDSLSSLDASTCSSDSLYGVSHDQTIPVVPVKMPTSSNEGTLTNSPVGHCTISVESNSENSSGGGLGLAGHSGESSSSAASLSPVKQEKRVRKTSWINPISMTKDGGYPATLDKLLSLFQHPGNFFSRQPSSPAITADDSNNSTTTKKDVPVLQQQENKAPSRKESPMGGLFAWTTIGRKDPVIVDEPIQMIETKVAQPNETNNKSIKLPLQPNCSPENTISLNTTTSHTSFSNSELISSSPPPPTSASSQTVAAVVSIPEKLQKEMKENISPEHTITTASIISVKSQMSPMQTHSAQQLVQSQNNVQQQSYQHQQEQQKTHVQPQEQGHCQQSEERQQHEQQKQHQRYLQKQHQQDHDESSYEEPQQQQQKDQQEQPNSQQQSQSNPQQQANQLINELPLTMQTSTHEKVLFEVGGDDDDDDDLSANNDNNTDDDTTNTFDEDNEDEFDDQSELGSIKLRHSSAASTSSSTTTTADSTSNKLSLGQITRDSLSILHKSSKGRDKKVVTIPADEMENNVFK